MIYPVEVPSCAVLVPLPEPEPRYGHISAGIEHTMEAASRLGCSVWLVWNGTSVRVDPGDTVDAIYLRWTEHRARFQEQQP